MHRDNNPYLIWLCLLMSQLKGLALPLAMGLAERIVCRLVNAGLWRSGRAFKMHVSSHRCLCMRTLAYWLPCLLVSNGRNTSQNDKSTSRVRQAQTEA